MDVPQALAGLINRAGPDVVSQRLPNDPKKGYQGSPLAGASVESQRLSMRSTSLDLSLADNSGRSVSLSFSHQQLDYSRTYTAAGVISDSQAGHGQNPFDQASHAAFSNSMHQVGLVHEQQSLSMSSTSLQIEGDISLLQEYFSAESTAQRIFDFVADLGAGFGQQLGAAMNDVADSGPAGPPVPPTALGVTDGTAPHTSSDQPAAPGGGSFKQFVDDISRGVRQGFADAQRLLGELPDVTQATQRLLDQMLERFSQDGTRLRAADLVAQTDTDE